MAHRLFYNKSIRRTAGGALFGGLLLKNIVKHVFPDDLFFPFYAYPSSQSYIMDAVKLLNQCKRDMGLTGGILPVNPFVSATTEVCGAGFSAFNLGQSQVGIPRSFFCDTVEEISRHNVLLGKLSNFQISKGILFEKVDENEIKLMESFLLSEDAKLFAIARHLSYFKRNYAIYQAFVSPLFVIIGYVLAFHLPKVLFSSLNKPVHILSIIGVSLAGILSAYIMCKVATAFLKKKISVQTDHDAANLSPKYAKGGIEMYDKLGQTNRALRVLLGRKGERQYTQEGDQVQSYIKLFSPNAPSFTKRKQYLNTILQSGSSQDSSTNIGP